MDDQTKENLDRKVGVGTSDKLEGNAKEAKGRIEQAGGDLSGDGHLKREGTKDKLEGKLQHALGEAKEGADKLLDDAKEALRKH